jgi:hypothetical protein
MAFRVDRFGSVKRFDKTPQGGVVAPSYLTRTGVFTYWTRDSNGKSVPFRELRHPDEVFHEDSLATLAGAPITRDHPAVPVNASNWKQLSIGHVGDDVQKSDERYVSAKVRIHDASAVSDVEVGKLTEYSCGYTCDLVHEKGVYNGEEFDGRQTNIRYNHVAMGGRGWGRAGQEVRIRVDGGVGIGAENNPYPECMTEAELAALRVAHQKAIDTLQAKLDAETSRADAANAALATEKARADAADKARTDAANPAAIDALVQTRLALVDGARKILGAEFKADGVPAREIYIATIAKTDSAFKADGRSDDYLQARFDAAVSNAAVVSKANADLAGAVAPLPGGERNDSVYIPGAHLAKTMKTYNDTLAGLGKKGS